MLFQFILQQVLSEKRAFLIVRHYQAIQVTTIKDNNINMMLFTRIIRKTPFP